MSEQPTDDTTHIVAFADTPLTIVWIASDGHVIEQQIITGPSMRRPRSIEEQDLHDAAERHQDERP